MDIEQGKTEQHILLGVAAVLLVVAFFIFQPFLSVLAVSGALAIVVSPVFEIINKKVRNKRAVASLITVICMVIVILIPLTFLTFQVFKEARNAYTSIEISATNAGTPDEGVTQTLSNKIEDTIHKYLPNVNINTKDYVSKASNWLVSNLGAFFSGTVSFSLKLFLGLFAIFYLLKDGNQFISFLRKLIPLNNAYIDEIFAKLVTGVRSILRGTLVISLIQGFFSGVGFWIAGVPNPALWGTAAAISALIPGVGTSLVLIPCLIFLFITGKTGGFIFLLIWGVAGVGTIDNFLSPRLMERGVNIHPLLILFSVLGGIVFFGPEGFILGPLAISLLFSVFSVYQRIAKNQIETEEIIEIR